MQRGSPRTPHQQYLHQQSQRRNSFADTETEGVLRIKNEVNLGRDVCGAPDDRNYFLPIDSDPALKDSSGYAFLPPDLTIGEFAVGIKTRKLRTCTGAARRPVVFGPGAKYEIAAVGVLSG